MEPKKVFDKFWFAKHQRLLLWLANSWLGNLIFGFSKMGHQLNPKKRIVKITPSSVAQYNRLIKIEGKIQSEFTEHFFVRNDYARRLYFVLLPLWYAMHVWDFIADPFLPQLSFGFSTLTVNPDGTNPGTTSANAVVGNNTTNQTWATKIAGAGTDVFQTDNQDDIVYMGANSASGKWDQLSRFIYLFDTSPLTSGANISAAVLSVFGADKYDTLAVTPTIDVYTTTPGSNTILAASDFAQFGTTSQTGSPITYAGWSKVAYNDFTLNGTGIGNISKTGISKFGVRNANYDVAAVSPTWSSLNFAGFAAASAHAASNKPKLVVTYSTNTNWTKDLPEIVTLTDTIKHDLTRFFSETLNLTATIATLKSKFASLVESFSIIDMIKEFLNGSDTFWSRSSKDASSWTDTTKHNASFSNKNKSGTPSWTDKPKD